MKNNRNNFIERGNKRITKTSRKFMRRFATVVTPYAVKLQNILSKDVYQRLSSRLARDTVGIAVIGDAVVHVAARWTRATLID